MFKEITQDEKERLLIKSVIETLEELPLDYHWAYTSKIKYAIGMLEGFLSVKYKK